MELPEPSAVLPRVASRGLPVLLVSRGKRGAWLRKDSTPTALPFAVDADGTLHQALRQRMTPERFLVAGAGSGAWRVDLPPSELPLLAAALRAGVLSPAATR